MKRSVVVLCFFLGACAENRAPKECAQLSTLLSEQRMAVAKLKTAFYKGSLEASEIKASIGAIEQGHTPVIDRCVPYAIDAGPTCSEFHEAGTLRDVNTMLHALRTAANGPEAPSRVFVGGMLDAASAELAQPKRGVSCLRAESRP